MPYGSAVIAALALLSIATGSADCQYLHGRVIDRQTGAPVASASVLVLNPDRSIRSGAITDADGMFGLHTTPGTIQLRIQRVGYAATGSKPLDLARTDTLGLEVQLVFRPAAIDSLTVTAEARGPRDPSGFFQRQTRLAGRFLGPYEVERRHPKSPSDLLHDIPGMEITPGLGGNRVLMTGRSRRCVPTIYVDGLLAHRGTQTQRRSSLAEEDGLVLDGLVNANAIRAMEAYQTGAAAPVRFRPVGPVGGGDCGVIVFWTRIGFGR